MESNQDGRPCAMRIIPRTQYPEDFVLRTRCTSGLPDRTQDSGGWSFVILHVVSQVFNQGCHDDATIMTMAKTTGPRYDPSYLPCFVPLDPLHYIQHEERSYYSYSTAEHVRTSYSQYLHKSMQYICTALYSSCPLCFRGRSMPTEQIAEHAGAAIRQQVPSQCHYRGHGCQYHCRRPCACAHGPRPLLDLSWRFLLTESLLLLYCNSYNT